MEGGFNKEGGGATGWIEGTDRWPLTFTGSPRGEGIEAPLWHARSRHFQRVAVVSSLLSTEENR